MEYRQLGETDLICSVLGFGTWAMGGNDYGPIDIDAASAAVRAAIDQGITLIDTAEAYGPYRSEEVLGKILGPHRQEIVLVTKVGFEINPEGEIVGRDSSRASVIARTHDCLKRLRTDWVDLLLIHWPDPDTPFEETLGALEALKSDGKIRYYGVSNFSTEMMQACEPYGRLAANQIGYNLFDRRVETDVLPYCQRHGLGFMAYGSLAYGLLTGAFTAETTFESWDWRSLGKAFRLPLFERENFVKELEVVERLKELAAHHGRSVAQLALAWVLSHPAVSVALVGMRNPSELAENVQAADWKLPRNVMEDIDRIFVEENVSSYRNVPVAV